MISFSAHSSTPSVGRVRPAIRFSSVDFPQPECPISEMNSPCAMSRLMSRSEEHTSELQSLMRISYAVFCLKKKTHEIPHQHAAQHNDKHTKHKHHPESWMIGDTRKRNQP